MKKCNKRGKRKKSWQSDVAIENGHKFFKALKLIRNVYVSKLQYGGYNQKSPDMRSIIRMISKQLINLKATFINELGRPFSGIDLLEALALVASFHRKKKLRILARKAVGSVRVVKNSFGLTYFSCT